MPATATAQQAPTVNQSGHPLPALTTYELRNYRRDLETAITFLDRQTPVPPARDRLQATLDDVIAEQDDRKRLPVRDHDVTTLTDAELEHTRRQLAASLPLARPGSRGRAPILARISAIDAEIAGRGTPARPARELHAHD